MKTLERRTTDRTNEQNCPKCYGKGILEYCDGKNHNITLCTNCSGTGKKYDAPEPMAQCPDCSGNGTVTLDQYNDGEFREGFCQTCEGRGSIPLTQYLLPIHEDEILADEVEA